MSQNEFTQDVSSARDQAKALFERGSERAHELSQRAQHMGEEMLARSRDMLGTVEKTIGAHPVIAIGTAFIGGLLLGALIVRR